MPGQQFDQHYRTRQHESRRVSAFSTQLCYFNSLQRSSGCLWSDDQPFLSSVAEQQNLWLDSGIGVWAAAQAALVAVEQLYGRHPRLSQQLFDSRVLSEQQQAERRDSCLSQHDADA